MISYDSFGILLIFTIILYILLYLSSNYRVRIRNQDKISLTENFWKNNFVHSPIFFFNSRFVGQDGSYLTELLLSKGYVVYGLIRRSSSFNTGRIEHLYHDKHESKVRYVYLRWTRPGRP